LNKNFKDVAKSDENYSEVEDEKAYEIGESEVVPTNREPEPLEGFYDESPRQKMPSPLKEKSENKVLKEEEEDIDEDEMIDVAEKIFIRIAEEIIEQKTSVRAIFQANIFDAEIDGEQYELLSPMGLLEGIKSLNIDDLQDFEIQYLLKVLSKPELDGAILM